MHAYKILTLSFLFLFSCGQSDQRGVGRSLYQSFTAEELTALTDKEEALLSELCTSLENKRTLYANYYRDKVFVFNTEKRACAESNVNKVTGLLARLDINTNLKSFQALSSLDQPQLISSVVSDTNILTGFCDPNNTNKRVASLSTSRMSFIEVQDRGSNRMEITIRTGVKENEGSSAFTITDIDYMSVSRVVNNTIPAGAILNRITSSTFGCEDKATDERSLELVRVQNL